MRRALLGLASLIAACAPETGTGVEAGADRAALEAVVEACDRGARRARCDDARTRLAQARRADRMAAYRQAH
ncbi:hypothetical protein [Brevundimonas sp.]|uniref:hypothetical protein n=1 Tax=Brevundimonas sp. TaxID=1871086 RepID=UPI0037C1A8EA